MNSNKELSPRDSWSERRSRLARAPGRPRPAETSAGTSAALRGCHDGRVIPAVASVLVGLALVGVAWSTVLVVRDGRLGDPLFWLVAVLEVGLLAQLVGGSVALVRTDRDVDGATFVGYLLTAVLVPPLGVAWAASEKSRWGPGVLLVACVTVAALVQRAFVVWQG